MKRLLRGLLFAIVVLTLASCAGQESFSPEKCAALKEKIESKQELSDADYTEMINQFGAIVKLGKEKEAEFGDDKEKMRKYATSEEGKTAGGYLLEFGLYLDGHTDRLSNSNKRKLNKFLEELKGEKK